MRLLLSVLLVVLLLLVAIPLLAQDIEVTEEAPVSESPVVVVAPDVVTNINPVVSEQLYVLGLALFKLIWNAAYLPFAAPMVTVLVAVTKRIFTTVSSPTLAFCWTVIIWIAYLAATNLGFDNQFQTAIGSLSTLGAVFLGITLTPPAAGALYDYANKHNVAIIGYARPTVPVAAEAIPPAPRELVPIAEMPRD